MAQLPPKIPSITQRWPSFPHQNMCTTMSNFMSTNTNTSVTAAHEQHHQQHEQQLPSWVDEFLDLSSAQLGSQGRSASDSLASLEECQSSDDGAATAGTTAHGFDVLGDDQLISILSDDIPLQSPTAASNPSSLSDESGNNSENPMAMDVAVSTQQHDRRKPKNEACEVESSCRSDLAAETAAPPSVTQRSTESIVSAKRVKRILANRQSAQRSRVRKLQYISELERSVTSLQTEVSALSPRVAFLDHHRLILNLDNSALKQRIAALAQDKIFKDAHQQALKKEIERLRQIFHQQNLQKMGNSVNNNGHFLHSPPPSQPQPPQPPYSTSAANSISALGM